MNLDQDPKLLPFREKIQTFFRNDYPQDILEKVAAGTSLTTAEVRRAEMALGEKGWLASAWPKEYGGPGWSIEEQYVFDEELERAGAPTVTPMGVVYVGPVIYTFGSEEQKAKWLPGVRDGSVGWAQGYSEPEAGSDLASLQFSAVRDGDEYILNGTKIWTTNADKADWMFCLVRTDPDAIKQEGISFLLIDMESEGVSASLIELISGESEFCQTFLDNVKVPKNNLVGELNTGWSVAKALLKHERKLMSEIGGDTPGPSFGPVQAAQQYVGLGTDGKLKDSALRDQLVRHEMDFRAVGLTHFRTFDERINGVADSNVPLIMKYVGTEEQKRKEELLLALLGSQGAGWGEGFNEDEILTTRGWAFSKALSIAGGSSEVQLNIIAKRVLGLPTA